MKTHTVPWDAHAQAHTQVSLRVQFIARTESLYFDFCFFNYYMFLVSGNFSLKHFSLNIIRTKFKTWLIIKYFRKNMLLISFLKKNITYHYLIRTYFHVRTFTNNVSVRSQPEPPGWYIDSWPWTVPLRVEPLPAVFVVGPMVLPGEKYTCNTIQLWRCTPTNARRAKSAIIALTGGATFLRFYQKISG